MSDTLKKAEKISYKKRKITSILTIFAIMLCFSFCFSPAFAEETASSTDSSSSDDDGNGSNGSGDSDSSSTGSSEVSASDMFDYVKELSNSVLGPDNYIFPFSYIHDFLLSGQAVVYFTEEFYTTDTMDALLSGITGSDQESFITDFEDALKCIAIFFVFVSVLTVSLKELEHGELTAESWLKIMITICLPVVFIIEYDTILEGLAKGGMYFHELLKSNIGYNFESITIERSSGLYGENNTLLTNLVRTIISMKIDYFDYIFALIKTLIACTVLITWNIAIVITILSGLMSNYVEIGLRHIFMPLAIANVAHDGMRSAGVRYIKRYLGCFIKIASITAAVELSFYVYDKVLLTDPSIAEKWIMLFLLLPLVKQAIKMCNEVVTEALGD